MVRWARVNHRVARIHQGVLVVVFVFLWGMVVCCWGGFGLFGQ